MIDATATRPGKTPRTGEARNSVGGADLAALRAQLEQQRSFRMLQIKELAATTQRNSAAATEEAIRQVALSLAEAATTVLAEIDDALDRIERGSYGRCQRCGDDIPLERLQTLPMAGHCMPCQARQELSGSTRGTPPGLREQAALDLVEEWGRGSFPASDPPANW